MLYKQLEYLRDKNGRFDVTKYFSNDLGRYNSGQTFLTPEKQLFFWKYGGRNMFIDYGEVIANHIAKHFGLESVPYAFAQSHGLRGVVSQDFKRGKERELYGGDFLTRCFKMMYPNQDLPFVEKLHNLDFIQNALQFLVEKQSMSQAEAQHVQDTMLKLWFFDFAIANTDRHAMNWGFLFDPETKKTRLAPVFDSGRCFNLYLTKEEFEAVLNPYFELPSKSNTKKMEQFFKLQDKDNTPSLFVKPNKTYDNMKNANIEMLKDFSELFPKQFESLLTKFYSIPFSQIFNQIQEETKVKVPLFVQTIVLNSFETRYTQVRNHYNQLEEEKQANPRQTSNKQDERSL